MAARPVVAMARATVPPGSLVLTAASSVSRVNVFPQPPLASMKMRTGSLESMCLITLSKISRCWLVIRLRRSLTRAAVCSRHDLFVLVEKVFKYFL